jgi:hypothetical protein
MAAQRASLSRELATSAPHEVWNAFIGLVSSDPADPFTPEQRAAALVFWYESEVQNGGHLQYFSNRGVEEAAQAVGALLQLGAPAHAAILQSALASLPSTSDPSPISVEEYVAIALDDAQGQFDRAFYEAIPSLRFVLQEYLASHLSAFVAFEESGA